MRKGVYATDTLKRMRMMPFAYRCGACGALNDGFYPAEASVAARDREDDTLTAAGRELTDAEHLSRAQREMASIAALINREIADRKWNGSPNSVIQCGACGEKARWSRPGMRTVDWIAALLVPFLIGVYELVYEGFWLHTPKAVLFGILLLAFSVALMIVIAVLMAARKRRIYAQKPECLPTLFPSPEALESWLNGQRRAGEPLFRGIDPRSPEASFLAEENKAAREADAAAPWVLCKGCLRTLAPGDERTYDGVKYCPACYGIVRQESETRSYLRQHRKRGGDIR